MWSTFTTPIRAREGDQDGFALAVGRATDGSTILFATPDGQVRELPLAAVTWDYQELASLASGWTDAASGGPQQSLAGVSTAGQETVPLDDRPAGS